jgi:AbrB family looped-hinge helix DNA binding protein
MQKRIVINPRGTITIPARLRRKYGLEPEGELIAEETEQGILLRPAVSMPLELYSEERIAEFAQDDAEVRSILATNKRKR